MENSKQELMKKEIALLKEQLLEKEIEVFKYRFNWDYESILNDLKISPSLILVERYHIKELLPLIYKYGYEVIEKKFLELAKEESGEQ